MLLVPVVGSFLYIIDKKSVLRELCCRALDSKVAQTGFIVVVVERPVCLFSTGFHTPSKACLLLLDIKNVFSFQ